MSLNYMLFIGEIMKTYPRGTESLRIKEKDTGNVEEIAEESLKAGKKQKRRAQLIEVGSLYDSQHTEEIEENKESDIKSRLEKEKSGLLGLSWMKRL